MALVNEEFNGKCCMCGEKAVAFWMCESTIFVCGICAIEKLPLLIGDAIAATPFAHPKTQLTNLIRMTVGNIWRAIALQAMSERRVRKADSETPHD